MKILAVNLGKVEPIGGRGSAKYYAGKTGIFKNAVAGPVFVGKLGLDGDAVVNTKHHGGVDQAIYIYSHEDYEYWEQKLGMACPAGLFGENLTVSGIESGLAQVGDRIQFGDVLLEVTSPRIPCSTFAARMNDAKFPKAFMAAKRPGIYCRVLHEGYVTADAVGTIEQYEGPVVTLAELFEAYPFKSINDETRARYRAVPSHWKLIAFLNGERETP